MTDASGTRPYLEGPIDLDEMAVLIRWAKYLGTTFGTADALCALRYYERLAWIASFAPAPAADSPDAPRPPPSSSGAALSRTTYTMGGLTSPSPTKRA